MLRASFETRTAVCNTVTVTHNTVSEVKRQKWGHFLFRIQNVRPFRNYTERISAGFFYLVHLHLFFHVDLHLFSCGLASLFMFTCIYFHVYLYLFSCSLASFFIFTCIFFSCSLASFFFMVTCIFFSCLLSFYLFHGKIWYFVPKDAQCSETISRSFHKQVSLWSEAKIMHVIYLFKVC